MADRWKARKTKELGLQRRLRRARAGETVFFFFGTPAERAAGCWRTRIYARGSHTQGACLRDSERLTVLAWQDLGRGLLLSENPHLRARFQIVHRRRDERRKVLAWRGRALSGYRLPSDGSFTRPLTPAAATSFPHRTSTRRRLRHHRDSTSPQPPGPQAPPRETID